MATLNRFDDAFDDLLRGFFVRPVGFEGTRNQTQVGQFRVDVSESENAYTIRAEIPGVRKEEIEISTHARSPAHRASRRPAGEACAGRSAHHDVRSEADAQSRRARPADAERAADRRRIGRRDDGDDRGGSPSDRAFGGASPPLILA